MEQQMHPCWICPHLSSSFTEHFTHTRTHLNARPYLCMVCGQRFGCDRDVVAHTDTCRASPVRRKSPAPTADVRPRGRPRRCPTDVKPRGRPRRCPAPTANVKFRRRHRKSPAPTADVKPRGRPRRCPTDVKPRGRPRRCPAPTANVKFRRRPRRCPAPTADLKFRRSPSRCPAPTADLKSGRRPRKSPAPTSDVKPRGRSRKCPTDVKPRGRPMKCTTDVKPRGRPRSCPTDVKPRGRPRSCPTDVKPRGRPRKSPTPGAARMGMECRPLGSQPPAPSGRQDRRCRSVDPTSARPVEPNNKPLPINVLMDLLVSGAGLRVVDFDSPSDRVSGFQQSEPQSSSSPNGLGVLRTNSDERCDFRSSLEDPNVSTFSGHGDEKRRSASECSFEGRTCGRFQCDLCGRRFRLERALQYHKIFHI